MSSQFIQLEIEGGSGKSFSGYELLLMYLKFGGAILGSAARKTIKEKIRNYGTFVPPIMGHLPIAFEAVILYDYHSLSNETRSLPSSGTKTHELQDVIKRRARWPRYSN